MSGYIIGKSARIRTYLDSDFFVSLCLWMRVAVSDYIMTECRCKCKPLDSSFWLAFSLNVSIRVRPCWHWFCWRTCLDLLISIGTSLDPRWSLSLSLCLFQCPSILSVICVCEQTRSARLACNSAKEDWFFIYLFNVYTYVASFLFVSLSFCMNICTSVQLYYDSLYVYILLFFALVILFLSEDLY